MQSRTLNLVVRIQKEEEEEEEEEEEKKKDEVEQVEIQ